MIFTKIAREVSATFRVFYKRSVIKYPFTIEVTRRIKDKGDTTLRLDYPLTKESYIFVVGGYVGDYANDISNKYGCSVFVTEPAQIQTLSALCGILSNLGLTKRRINETINTPKLASEINFFTKTSMIIAVKTTL